MSKSRKIHLGINIDHVATLRQARKEGIPSLEKAAREAVRGGADSITVHLREDRRHIQDADVRMLKHILKKPLNFESSISDEIIEFVLKVKPAKSCLVPEKRQELTTEGGLDLFSRSSKIKKTVKRLQEKGIEVSLFIDPAVRQIQKAAEMGADAIEIHTGAFANASNQRKPRELARIKKTARLASTLGLKVHAGHGLDYKNTKAILEIREIVELNIGYSIVCESVFVGLKQSVKKMKQMIRGSGLGTRDSKRKE